MIMHIPMSSMNYSFCIYRLADRLVFWVIQGKSVDEIYLDEKNRARNAKNAMKKPIGYVGPEEYAIHKEDSVKQNPNVNPSSSKESTINWSNGKSSQDMLNQQSENCDEKRPLTNSSSKNNIGSMALRENHDSKSAQKNAAMNNLSFSGKNQKNLSPYNDKTRSTCNLNKQKLLGGSMQSNVMKVKRHISFE